MIRLEFTQCSLQFLEVHRSCMSSRLKVLNNTETKKRQTMKYCFDKQLVICEEWLVGKVLQNVFYNEAHEPTH